ncbi:hypothetical protein PYCCODRAFT_173988 [Trametes coccinea BRFM310]|uniref:Uncharacterized protein n=1 Tax=Trametes coccinea (strain BRFM310) TaxID=1353009 RepID=A0A1Y2ISG7_TRAC3|nr:hypothetical protein PYCCODRAFT_173988 [Trametes coccinea BRFM310]
MNGPSAYTHEATDRSSQPHSRSAHSPPDPHKSLTLNLHPLSLLSLWQPKNAAQCLAVCTALSWTSEARSSAAISPLPRPWLGHHLDPNFLVSRPANARNHSPSATRAPTRPSSRTPQSICSRCSPFGLSVCRRASTRMPPAEEWPVQYGKSSVALGPDLFHSIAPVDMLAFRTLSTR